MPENPLHGRNQWLESRVEELRGFEESFYKLSAGLVEVEAMLDAMTDGTLRGWAVHDLWISEYAKSEIRKVLDKVRELQDG